MGLEVYVWGYFLASVCTVVRRSPSNFVPHPPHTCTLLRIQNSDTITPLDLQPNHHPAQQPPGRRYRDHADHHAAFASNEAAPTKVRHHSLPFTRHSISNCHLIAAQNIYNSSAAHGAYLRHRGSYGARDEGMVRDFRSVEVCDWVLNWQRCLLCQCWHTFFEPTGCHETLSGSATKPLLCFLSCNSCCRTCHATLLLVKQEP